MTETSISKPKKICKVIGCGQKHSTNGYCGRHYCEHKYSGKISGNPARGIADPNIFIFYGDVCEIVLFDIQGYESGRAIIDTEDYEKVKPFKWHLAISDAGIKYAATSHPHTVVLHRLIFPLYKMTDHVNRDGLDNRKANLRECTHSQNQCNSGPQKRNKLQLKGVHIASNSTWRAVIKKDNVQYHLGCFSSPIEAAKAYNKKALELHGEFAFQNKVD